MMIEDGIPSLRTIRYLGNKRKILNNILKTITDNLQRGVTILDLFAGTNCVGFALKKNYTIYSNDIQKYSYVIAKALIEDNETSLDQQHAKADLSDNYKKNYTQLQKFYETALIREKNYFSRNFHHSNYEKYRDFCINFPYYNFNKKRGNNKNLLSIFSDESISKYKKNNKKFPYILFSTYFVNGYFGIKQCLQIDSLRYAIDQINENYSNLKMIYLTALIYAINLCVSSTGHFAQFRNINSETSCKEVIKERKKDVTELFYDLIDELFSKAPFGTGNNIAWNDNYHDLLSEKNSPYTKIKNVDLVYADPPYTSDHYSRYYHVLETLTKYDYPSCIGKGRYRDDRHSSNFSIKKNVEEEFRKLISSVNNIEAKLLLSYTNVGLVSVSKLKNICSKYYNKVSHTTIEYNHSNQGRRTIECNNSKGKRKEYLIYCE